MVDRTHRRSQLVYLAINDKCLPFYDLLLGNKKFIWDERCSEAFEQLTRYLTTPSVLAKPEKGDTLYLYIAVSDAVVSSVLDKEERGEQRPILYTSQSMTDAETRYSTLKKMALAVMTSARKLRPYFQSHSIVVLTNLPLRTIMQNAKSFGQTLKMGNRAQKVRCYISKQAIHKVASTG